MLLALILLVAPALAEDPEFSETEKEAEEVEKAETHLSAELGGAMTSGNSELFTVTSTTAFSHKWTENKLALVAGATWAKGRVDADGSGSIDDVERAAPMVENARRVSADARYDRFFGERNSLYALAGAFTDPFAGYDLRTHEQLGYSRILVDEEKTHLVAEIGMDYAQENFVPGVDPNYADVIAARVMVGLRQRLTEGVEVTDTLEAYENVLDLEDLRVNNDLAVTVRLSDVLGLKLSHALRFDNQPVEGFRSLDQTTLLTLVATLL
jgi:putative salt-induced outer membrane protein YdiY